jgi:hypothetical protein
MARENIHQTIDFLQRHESPKKNHPMIMITGRGGWLSWPRAENTDSFMNAVRHDLKLSCLDFILIDDSVMTITESESIFFSLRFPPLEGSFACFENLK